MPNIQEEIEEQIALAKKAAGWENVGVIREIGDGVAKIEGLSDAMLNEMIDLGHGITGLALNLEETEVGVIIIGDYTQLEEGDEVRSTAKDPSNPTPRTRWRGWRRALSAGSR